jgi:hypothetical protein
MTIAGTTFRGGPFSVALTTLLGREPDPASIYLLHQYAQHAREPSWLGRGLQQLLGRRPTNAELRLMQQAAFEEWVWIEARQACQWPHCQEWFDRRGRTAPYLCDAHEPRRAEQAAYFAAQALVTAVDKEPA